mmetsp:Transcript_29738/g.46684  ORF Transcript_29738/g.46684 Transcript_29738/m.46684 type:complete len:212 (-) Transcript_29738:508-1143(-)
MGDEIRLKARLEPIQKSLCVVLRLEPVLQEVTELPPDDHRHPALALRPLTAHLFFASGQFKLLQCLHCKVHRMHQAYCLLQEDAHFIRASTTVVRAAGPPDQPLLVIETQAVHLTVPLNTKPSSQFLPNPSCQGTFIDWRHVKTKQVPQRVEIAKLGTGCIIHPARAEVERQDPFWFPKRVPGPKLQLSFAVTVCDVYHAVGRLECALAND